MSDSQLGAWIKDKWPELVVLVVVVGMGSFVVSLNREVGELTTGQASQFDGLANKIGDGVATLQAKVEGAEGKLSAEIEGSKDEYTALFAAATVRLDHLGEGLEELSGVPKTIAVLEERVNQLGGGKFIQETKTVAFRPTISQYIVQCGMFSPATRVEGTADKYRWEMKFNLDVNQVFNIGATFEKPIPGTAILAELSPDGRFCEMTIKGADDPSIARLLQEGVPGCVNIGFNKPAADEIRQVPAVAPDPADAS